MVAGAGDALSRPSAPITAIVTAYRRPDVAITTLAKILACDPPPAEVLVHVDGNDTACAAAIQSAHASVRLTLSNTSVGPGGGRNRLIAQAHHHLIASFDDDAFPIDADYFARVHALFDRFSEAAIVTARVFHADETLEAARPEARWVADFSGGACAYRKAAFASLGGYVPVPLAYGMEEVDLAMRLHAQGGRVLDSPWLRVFHDTDRKRHGDPRVTAATISNIAVLAALRYPALLWPVGALQCLNRVRWLLGHGRRAGVIAGIVNIPSEIRRYRAYRHRLSPGAVRSYLRLRRQPTAVPSWQGATV